MEYHRFVFLSLIVQFQLSSTQSFLPVNQEQQIIRLSSPRMIVSEGDKSVKIVLQRLDGSIGALRVRYITLGFTAIKWTDYIPKIGVLKFDDGQTEATVEVMIIDDNVLESIESFLFLVETEDDHVFTIISIHDDDIYSSWSEWSEIAKCCTAACRATQCIQIRTRTCRATYKSMCRKQLKETRYQSCYSDDCDEDDDSPLTNSTACQEL